ncbi:hypothetical protein [Nitrosospira briensis]|uniref:hypothetical protein n=1 Tax=Nitrosospira briensis TaxID=35799 RepID=UPI0008EB7B6B|nr:hypothetical protein [Nitrosospira briensis]SFN69108.1 hypothetical protein SAMN05216332_101217 [Nitrosospira briensis]
MVFMTSALDRPSRSAVVFPVAHEAKTSVQLEQEQTASISSSVVITNAEQNIRYDLFLLNQAALFCAGNRRFPKHCGDAWRGDNTMIVMEKGPEKGFLCFPEIKLHYLLSMHFSAANQKVFIPSRGIVDIYPIRVYDCLSAIADVLAKCSGWFHIETVNVE